MIRLAWFTPLPPTQSGIATYSVEILPLLCRRYAIDVFAEMAQAPPREPVPNRAGYRAFDAHDFVWRHARAPYDLVVYQLGNATCHDYMWPYLVRYPGLVVLHDAELHHARAASLLARGRTADYRAEFTYSHPDVSEDLLELATYGMDDPLYYFWPMLRPVFSTARQVAVHNARVAAELKAEFPDAAIDTISMGVPDPLEPFPQPHVGAGAGAGKLLSASPPAGGPTTGVDAVQKWRTTVRTRHHIPPDAVVFASFGLATPEKRISQAVNALAAITPHVPNTHLLVGGATVSFYDIAAEAEKAGVASRVTVAGFVLEEELTGYIAASDVCLCMRWPTARESSASWLRCLSMGKPTVITDLVHTIDVPSLDPRSWAPFHPTLSSPTAGAGEEGEPVSVRIDILDEDHSLRLAMLRLARDAELRARLGRRARAWWQAHHTLERMAADYERVIELALSRPAPGRAGLPPHLLADGSDLARRLLTDVGVSTDLL